MANGWATPQGCVDLRDSPVLVGLKGISASAALEVISVPEVTADPPVSVAPKDLPALPAPRGLKDPWDPGDAAFRFSMIPTEIPTTTGLKLPSDPTLTTKRMCPAIPISMGFPMT